jgi:1,4-dihydroxy-6-naphthoate synthase
MLIMSNSTVVPHTIRVAHSPDADDAFMFYALAHHQIDTEGLTFEHILADIETLNKEALKGTYELTALSYHAYAYLADQYALLPVGSSIGDKYGPVLIATSALTKQDLLASGKPVAVPGEWTTAYLALKLWEPTIKTEIVPFDEITQAVESGRYLAGLIIHEDQVTYADKGLHKVVDLGEWWFETTNLVLPLGCNGIRKDLGEEMIQKISRVLYRSVAWGLANRAETLAGCQQYARDLDPAKTDQFVGMYVNDMTLEADVEIRKAVRLILAMGAGLGIIPKAVDPEWVDFKMPAAVG